jgi:hypothetical protein
MTFPALMLWAGLTLAGSTADAAAPASKVVVAPVHTADGVTERVADRLGGRVRDGLARGAVEIVPNAPGTDPGACTTARCLRKLGDSTGAAYLVVVQVDRNDRDYRVRTELYSTRTGDLTSESDLVCELCGLQEVEEFVGARVAILSTKVLPATRLRITSTPRGARVELDGELVGQTPFEEEVFPGEHRVRLTLPDHMPRERTVRLAEGVTEELDVDLPSAPDAGGPRNVVGPLGWVSVGAGLAAAGAGIALLVLDERPIQRKCGSDVQDPQGDCPVLYDTVVPGALMVGAGVALVATGIALVIRARRKGSHTPKRAALSPRGAGLQLRF